MHGPGIVFLLVALFRVYRAGHARQFSLAILREHHCVKAIVPLPPNPVGCSQSPSVCRLAVNVIVQGSNYVGNTKNFGSSKYPSIIDPPSS